MYQEYSPEYKANKNELKERMIIFVINLDRDIDRMGFINKQASDKGITFERVSGVYGRDLSKEDIRNSVNRFRWLCAVGRPPLIGEIGCALSHLKIYQMMIDQNIPIACILEDDIFLLDGFQRKLEQIKQWADPNKPIVVRLNYSGDGRDEDERTTNSGVVKVSTGTAACSYILTQSAAKALIKDNFPLVRPSDAWYVWDKYNIIQLYNCDTKVCWHNNAASGFSSTITSKDQSKLYAYAELHLQRVLFKIMRVPGNMIDELFLRISH